MTLEWMKAELASSRFGSDIRAALREYGAGEELITQANITSSEDNAKRLEVLRHYRSWFDLNVNDYDWQLVELNKDEVGQLKYIDYSYWNELSKGTRLVKEAVESIRDDVIVFDVSNNHFHAVANAVEASQDFLPIIVITDRNKDNEIVEGHVRATGYVLANKPKRPLTAIIGTIKV